MKKHKTHRTYVLWVFLFRQKRNEEKRGIPNRGEKYLNT